MTHSLTLRVSFLFCFSNARRNSTIELELELLIIHGPTTDGDVLL